MNAIYNKKILLVQVAGERMMRIESYELYKIMGS